MDIILASASPRRKELLNLAGLAYRVVPSTCEEILPPNITPDEAVKSLAEQKCEDVFSKNPNAVVIAADTLVALNGNKLGKPKSKEEAFQMLRSLSGSIHTVYTGVCIMKQGKKTVFCAASNVEFYPLSDDEINDYIATGEPMDKAGAYGIQGRGSLLVKSISGDYFNIVGLPLAETVRALKPFIS